MHRPPTILTAMITRPAIGVAADELAGTVHRAVEVRLRRQFLAAAAGPPAGRSAPAFRSASMAICRPGRPSRANRAATSLIRVAPLVITTNWITAMIANMINPTSGVVGRHELAERADHLAGRVQPLRVGLRQNQPRRGHVQHQAAERGGQQQRTERR